MSRPQRLRTVSYIGFARYFLTFCVSQRRPAFDDASVVHATLEQFRKTATYESFAILAYCFMPDHAHVLIEGRSERSDLRRFAKMARQRAGAVHRRRFSTVLWQPGYFERVLREGDDARQIARYILNNPVRAGLAKSPTEYPHLGSDLWTLSELLDSVV